MFELENCLGGGGGGGGQGQTSWKRDCEITGDIIQKVHQVGQLFGQVLRPQTHRAVGQSPF